MKMGRNQKCWCGSGLKFKHCHFERENAKPLSKGKILEYENTVSNREYCYCPTDLRYECDQVIKAHTISKVSGLTHIADNTNHVLGLKQNLSQFIKNSRKPKFERLGVNKASTFKGFCKKHDKILFSSFEDSYFIGELDQCYALTFRSVAKELYAKENALQIARFMKRIDNGRPIAYQVYLQEYLQMYTLGLKTAISELYRIKENLDHKLLNRKFKPYSFLVLESTSPLPIVTSSIVNPTHDFNGNFLQDLTDLHIIPQHLCFNSFSSNGKSFVILSWLQDAKVVEKFIQSFLEIDDEDIFSALIYLFLNFAENTFISPNWWQQLSSTQLNEIEKMFATRTEQINHTTLSNRPISFGNYMFDEIYRIS